MAGKMRFNSQALLFLAQQQSTSFDKEGILQIKEKQEGLFRSRDAFVERWCKLRGNLLFYCRTKEKKSDPVGIVVLERCAVELDLDEELPFSFVLLFEGDDKVQKLAASCERERDGWIEALHIASYECMKMQLESLREQLKAKTGRDPINEPEPSELPDATIDERPDDSEPFMEMCITCDNLPGERDSQTRKPNSFAAVHILTPPQQQWVAHAHTEVVERDSNPGFLTTIGFSNKSMMKLTTRIKVIIYDVKERMTNTMTQIGSAMFTVTDLLTAPACRLRLRLGSADMTEVGNMTLMAWQNESHFVLGSDHQDVADNKNNVLLPIKNQLRRIEMMKPLHENIITKTYRFPTNADTQLSVHEYLGESKLTFYLPRQFLKLRIEEEEKRITELQELGQLRQDKEVLKLQYMNSVLDLNQNYCQINQSMGRLQGPPFKASCKKASKELEFAPLNLHLQRLWVHNEAKNTSACYDISTMGAFTAYPQKYKQGGLRRMIDELQEQLSTHSDGTERLEKTNQILNNITTLKAAIGHFCDEVCRSANQGEATDLSNSVSALSDKVRQLIQVCDSSLIAQAIDQYIKVKISLELRDSPQLGHRGSPRNSPKASKRSPGSGTSPEKKNWKWSGTDFVKSPTEEPWELTRTNMEASLLCVVTGVEDTVSSEKTRSDPSCWLSCISPIIIKLKSCVEVSCERARAALTFCSVDISSHCINLLHRIKYRRDVVFSQAITTATAAFMTKLHSSMTDEVFLQQIQRVGVLMQFEGLLSCHGDEMGMLEDFAVGVEDLFHVNFKIEEASNPNDVLPSLQKSSLLKSGGRYPDFNRYGYIVRVPVMETMFKLLPRELQKGQLVRVVPVIFNVGINEKATIAEKIGNLAVQEHVNLDSYQTLSKYWEKYSELVGDEAISEKSKMPVEQMLRHLHLHVVSKKHKNVEMLHQASEICRLLSGIRFTSCKSAKDRTSMSVTLEQVQLLQREQDLASHVFVQALDCMRSEGVRRENTQKNTGSRKYAFNSLQLTSFPKLYRPPNGTFGNVQT